MVDGCPRRAKVGTKGKKRERIQTVNFRSVRGRTILMRAYDKGVESGVASPGELIRFERQRRYRKRDELSVSEARDLEISKLFIGRELESLARVTAEVVCDQWGARSTGSMSSCGRVGSGRRGPMRLPAS